MKAIGLSFLLVAAVSAAHADSLKAQIDASNKTVAAAMKKRDFVALGKLIKAGVTSNFVYVEEGQKGKPQSFDEMMTNMKMGLSAFSKLTVVESKTLSVKETGKTATSKSQHTMSGVITGPDKKPHVMTMVGVSTDSYVKEGSKWKMTKMSWKNGTMTMDGKPMNPSQMGGH